MGITLPDKSAKPTEPSRVHPDDLLIDSLHQEEDEEDNRREEVEELIRGGVGGEEADNMEDHDELDLGDHW